MRKQEQNQFAIKWIKEGKKLKYGTKTREILLWNLKNFEANPTSLQKTQVRAIAVSKFYKYIISGDKNGSIVFSNVKLR